VSLPVGPIRSIAEQEVLHDPEVIAEPDPATPWYTSNRAHTLVIGAKKGPTDPEPRTRLLRMCRPAIKLAVPWEPDGE
jgi:hypothetical protein